jgi:hypothetical protein
MNERIRELMGKTLDDKFSHTWDTMTYEGLLMFSEKFALLIVQECARELDDRTVFVRGIRAGTWIKNHWGIEE